MKYNIFKRILMIFVAFWITVLSVFSSYKEAQCAEVGVVAGVAVGLKSILTALTVGGVLKGVAVAGGVILGGIGLHELATMTDEDVEDFKTGIKDSFQDFVKEYEKNQIIQDNAQITEQEAITQATNKAIGITKNFWDNAIDVTTTTGKGLTLESVDRWTKFNEVVGVMAVRDYSQTNIGSEITSSSVISVPVLTGINSHTFTNMTNLGSNCAKIGNSWYITDGQIYNGYVYGGFMSYKVNANDPVFVYYNTDTNLVNTWAVNVNTNEVYRCRPNLYGWTGNVSGVYENTNIPIMHMSYGTVFGNNDQAFYDYVSANWRSLFSVSEPEEEFTSTEALLKHIFENNGIAQSINQGVRDMVNEQKKTLIKSGDIPIKKSSLRVYDVPDSDVSGYTGEIGWDIPQGLVDSFPANPSFPRVAGETGVITVPLPNVIPKEGEDGTVVIPEDTPIEDTADIGDEIPDDEPVDPEPQPTIKDWIDENIGPFFPSGMDITNFFPFCIPFDIYYMFTSLVATPETPRFEIPFAYPSQLQPYLGESYTFVLDFADFEIVARILKIMLSLLFIFGLMKITRSIIRG